MKKIFTSMAIAAIALSAASANAEEIQMSVSGYAYDYTTSKTLYEFTSTVTTELTSDGDGVYTFPNFLNSGAPVSFKFNERQSTKDDGATITITSNFTYDEGYEEEPDLLTPNNEYLELSLTTSDNSTLVILDPYIYLGNYSYSSIVYGFTDGITNNGKTYKYYAYLSMAGYDLSDQSVFFDLEFYFGDMDNSAVSEISADKNAPVEYYNLSGVRVENPANGLFIRKQGGDVKKVMLK